MLTEITLNGHSSEEGQLVAFPMLTVAVFSTNRVLW